MADVAQWPAVLRNGRALLGLFVFLLLFLVAAAAPLLAPHDPLEQDLVNSFLPPFWRPDADPQFLFGTDSLGRDIFSRLIYGARIAFIVAVVAASLVCVLGTMLGLLSGYYGGWIDTGISRLVDVWMSFPPVLLSIVLAAVIGAGLQAVIIAIVVVDWTRFCRIVRAEVLVQREQDYVTAALTMGLGRPHIMLREILPNILPTLAVLYSLEMGIAIIVEAILSFVGLSVASDAPTWGGLIQEGRLYINQAWWLLALPVGCIIVTVLGLNALGDGLRESLDPVLRR
ncbi:MAG TPA: ABC transporter permease [Candidatus Cybelea sp.]|nr:ABC transporter permease [Candidatus Cybelea sp.]